MSSKTLFRELPGCRALFSNRCASQAGRHALGSMREHEENARIISRRRGCPSRLGVSRTSIAAGFLTARVGNPIIDKIRANGAGRSPILHELTTMTENSSPDELNLTVHRISVSVWDRRGWDGSRERLTPARWLVGFGGGALAVHGLRQRSIVGALLAGLGGSLAWWALAGEGDLSEPRRSCSNAHRGGTTISSTRRRPIHFRQATRRRGRRRSAPACAGEAPRPVDFSASRRRRQLFPSTGCPPRLRPTGARRTLKPAIAAANREIDRT
jgi:hypothetical protein